MNLEVNASRKWINIEAAEQLKASESKARKYLNEVLFFKIAMPSVLSYPPGIVMAAENVMLAMIVATNKLMFAKFFTNSGDHRSL